MKSICQFCSVGCKCKWTIVIVKRRLQRRHRRQRQRCWPFQRPFCAMQWHTMAPFYRQAALFCPGPTYRAALCPRIKHVGILAAHRGSDRHIRQGCSWKIFFPTPWAVLLLFYRKGQEKPAHFQLTTSLHQGTSTLRQLREEQSWEKLTQFLCFTEWGLPTHVQLWLWDFWNSCAFLYINE